MQEHGCVELEQRAEARYFAVAAQRRHSVACWRNNSRKLKMTQPPNGLPIYRVLTGPDDAGFCRRVSEALELGYRLHGGPALTFNGQDVIVAQAVVWSGQAAGH